MLSEIAKQLKGTKKPFAILTMEGCILDGGARELSGIIAQTLSEMGKEMNDPEFIVRFAQAILAVYGNEGGKEDDNEQVESN